MNNVVTCKRISLLQVCNHFHVIFYSLTGKSLLWVAFLGLIVLYMYAVLSFAILHESFFIANARFPLHCENLGQCFVSVIRYGLLNTLGAVRILSMSDRSFIISHAQ